jgi:hypothetical protein
MIGPPTAQAIAFAQWQARISRALGNCPIDSF